MFARKKWRQFREVALAASKYYGFCEFERANPGNCRKLNFLGDDSFEECMGRSSETHGFDSPRVRLLETVANFFRADIAIAEAFNNLIFGSAAPARAHGVLARFGAVWHVLARSGVFRRCLARFGAFWHVSGVRRSRPR